MKGAGALTRKDRHRIGRRSIAAEARTSKEAGLRQWPGAGRGKRDATLTFENFAYLALGLTHDAPIEAPTRMLAAGAMRLHAIARGTFHGEDVASEPVAIDHEATVRLAELPVAPTLLGTMSTLIEAFAGETLPAMSFRLDLWLSGQPSATLHIGGASTYRAFYQPAQDRGDQGPRAQTTGRRSGAAWSPSASAGVATLPSGRPASSRTWLASEAGMVRRSSSMSSIWILRRLGAAGERRAL